MSGRVGRGVLSVAENLLVNEIMYIVKEVV